MGSKFLESYCWCWPSLGQYAPPFTSVWPMREVILDCLALGWVLPATSCSSWPQQGEKDFIFCHGNFYLSIATPSTGIFSWYFNWASPPPHYFRSNTFSEDAKCFFNDLICNSSILRFVSEQFIEQFIEQFYPIERKKCARSKEASYFTWDYEEPETRSNNFCKLEKLKWFFKNSPIKVSFTLYSALL